MDVTLKDGFYNDPESNRTFYIKNGMVPPFVKSKPSEWQIVKLDKEEKMTEFNSHDFEDIYKKLKININELGCIMLDLEASGVPAFPNNDDLYFAKNEDKFWIKGFVAGKTPHVTLLYGLLEPGPQWKEYVDKVLKDWKLNEVKIKEVGFFPSNIPDEPYYCIVAHIEITPKLLEGHYRLQLLPHIDTFPDYKAHFTLAYVKKDEIVKKRTIDFYNRKLKGKVLKISGLNYGGKEVGK